jgi:hypothetical protein
MQAGAPARHPRARPDRARQWAAQDRRARVVLPLDAPGTLRYPAACVRATRCKVRQRTVTPPGRPVPGSIPGSPTIPSLLPPRPGRQRRPRRAKPAANRHRARSHEPGAATTLSGAPPSASCHAAPSPRVSPSTDPDAPAKSGAPGWSEPHHGTQGRSSEWLGRGGRIHACHHPLQGPRMAVPPAPRLR